MRGRREFSTHDNVRQTPPRRRDLIRSKADALASTANYLKAYGWKKGQSYQPGTANYAVIGKWNKAKVYQQTIAVLAGKIGG